MGEEKSAPPPPQGAGKSNTDSVIPLNASSGHRRTKNLNRSNSSGLDVSRHRLRPTKSSGKNSGMDSSRHRLDQKVVGLASGAALEDPSSFLRRRQEQAKRRASHDSFGSLTVDDDLDNNDDDEEIAGDNKRKNKNNSSKNSTVSSSTSSAPISPPTSTTALNSSHKRNSNGSFSEAIIMGEEKSPPPSQGAGKSNNDRTIPLNASSSSSGHRRPKNLYRSSSSGPDVSRHRLRPSKSFGKNSGMDSSRHRLDQKVVGLASGAALEDPSSFLRRRQEQAKRRASHDSFGSLTVDDLNNNDDDEEILLGLSSGDNKKKNKNNSSKNSTVSSSTSSAPTSPPTSTTALNSSHKRNSNGSFSALDFLSASGNRSRSSSNDSFANLSGRSSNRSGHLRALLQSDPASSNNNRSGHRRPSFNNNKATTTPTTGGGGEKGKPSTGDSSRHRHDRNVVGLASAMNDSANFLQLRRKLSIESDVESDLDSEESDLNDDDDDNDDINDDDYDDMMNHIKKNKHEENKNSSMPVSTCSIKNGDDNNSSNNNNKSTTNPSATTPTSMSSLNSSSSKDHIKGSKMTASDSTTPSSSSQNHKPSSGKAADRLDQKVVGLANAAVEKPASFLRRRREFDSSTSIPGGNSTVESTDLSYPSTTTTTEVVAVVDSKKDDDGTSKKNNKKKVKTKLEKERDRLYQNHLREERKKYSIEIKETTARDGAITNPWHLLVLRIKAALKILCFYLISLESLVGVALTIVATLYWYQWGEARMNNNNDDADVVEDMTLLNNTTSTTTTTTTTNTTEDGLPSIFVTFTTTVIYTTTNPTTKTITENWNGDMALVLVTFAVVSPITVAIRMAFTRRERALEHIGEIRAYFQHIYFMHCLWDWSKNGGRAASKVDFLQHCDQVLEHLIAMGDEQARFLSLPTMTRGWNRVTFAGRAEAERTVQAAYGLLESITIQRFTRLTVMAERLKAAGLIPSEVSRGRAFERYMCARLEQLRLLKMYRTPQALWSFARIFTLILPPFYGPTFAQVAHDMDSLAIGLIFGALTSLVLTALLESVQVLEDPFTATISLDGIDVREEFQILNYHQLVKIRHLFFPTAPAWPLQPPNALTGMRYDPEVHFHSTPEEREALIQADAIAYEEMMEEGGMHSEYDDYTSHSGTHSGGVGTGVLVDTGAPFDEQTHSGGENQSTAGSVVSRMSAMSRQGSVARRNSLTHQGSVHRRNSLTHQESVHRRNSLTNKQGSVGLAKQGSVSRMASLIHQGSISRMNSLTHQGLPETSFWGKFSPAGRQTPSKDKRESAWTHMSIPQIDLDEESSHSSAEDEEDGVKNDMGYDEYLEVDPNLGDYDYEIPLTPAVNRPKLTAESGNSSGSQRQLLSGSLHSANDSNHRGSAGITAPSPDKTFFNSPAGRRTSAWTHMPVGHIDLDIISSEEEGSEEESSGGDSFGVESVEFSYGLEEDPFASFTKEEEDQISIKDEDKDEEDDEEDVDEDEVIHA